MAPGRAFPARLLGCTLAILPEPTAGSIANTAPRCLAGPKTTRTLGHYTGLMPAASLAGRSELLAWLNRTLGTDYLRLEECADCVAYAQLLEAVHPGTVPLHRLHFRARRDAERQHNAKILAAALHRANIAWPHDARTPLALADGRFVDHHEFLQWLVPPPPTPSPPPTPRTPHTPLTPPTHA